MVSKLKQILLDAFHIAWKDLLELWRDRMRLAILILMPVFLLVIIGYVFPTDNTAKDVPFGMVNHDEGMDNIVIGDLMVELLSVAPFGAEDKYLDIVNLDSEDEAKIQIKEKKIYGAVVIPNDFTEKTINRLLKGGDPGTITIIFSQVDPQMALLLSDVIPSAFYDITPDEVKALAEKHGIPENITEELANHIPPVAIAMENVPPGATNYFEAMAPGVMAIVAMLSSMLGMAVSLTQEKEVGTLDGILVAPINRSSILLGKVFAQIVRGFIQTMIVLILAVAAFGVVVYGSVPLVILLLFLTVFSFTGMGILISAIADKQETATILAMLLTAPAIFLCDALFPVEQMPSFMQGLSKAVPLTYAVDALKEVIVLGGGVGNIGLQLGVLVAFGAGLFAIAIPVFRRIIVR